MAEGLTIRDGISPALLKLVKRSRNLKGAMADIERQVLAPKKAAAWQRSGLKSDSGELEDSVTLWHGKKSAGVTVKSKPGHDKVIPKATLHVQGARKGHYVKHSRIRVKSHTRSGRRVSGYTRKNIGSPWGNVPARDFLPRSFSFADKRRIETIIRRYVRV